MNATSLYVSTCRLIILADPADKSTWTDLFRLVPYLRQSLSCTVCGNLLKEPYTPTSSGCQHHVCKKCKGGRKKLKPSCSWCKDYENYTENLQLRILLQCYKKLCEYFMGTEVYKTLLDEDEVAASVNGGTVASSGLIDLIQEGAGFSDDYKSTGGLSKSAYSILPCVYTNSASTQTQHGSSSSSSGARSSRDSPNSRSTANGSPMYSVMYAGSGNKITIKRKAMDELDSPQSESSSRESKSLGFKKPSNRSRNSTGGKRKGCRCGNATATPGKLTCCGQRCPCYVDSKPCTECKCKGCRNPHRPDGMKVRPHIPQLVDTLQLTLNNPDSSPSCSGSMDSLDTDTLTMEAMEESLSYTAELKSSNIKVYTSQLQEVSPSLPATIMMDEDLAESPDDDMSSPHDYTLASPQGYDVDVISPQSAETQDVTSDIEVDV
ncbi:E3 ubiquitin-protein ligase MSL2 isoform X2 [Bombyx mandarina]|uniref:E3 ubiquitin-protein ligase MSL2 n=2 Tax=Bombyx TaxID=7090 RepID=A5JPL8_BOMMO|nr:MSL2 protein [Bombyx mori]XP_028040812.1 E3 ubiquitin-protein ligase MSL2 isoform X2 [Bombyx mandarina]ABQ51915.1 MSL2 protein [Bombyx mori]